MGRLSLFHKQALREPWLSASRAPESPPARNASQRQWQPSMTVCSSDLAPQEAARRAALERQILRGEALNFWGWVLAICGIPLIPVIVGIPMVIGGIWQIRRGTRISGDAQLQLAELMAPHITHLTSLIPPEAQPCRGPLFVSPEELQSGTAADSHSRERPAQEPV
ncbi:hypothetical protein WJX72_005429 [[Myrmecia] bisecta]|uniref:Uncharacterized protein n=1 Tax=[Myrmecia] bisecta TaxID=41462 RepID=A0AAW1PG80_9CHLO